MSDDNDNLFTEQGSPGRLLDELSSLKELLDEEHEEVASCTPVAETNPAEDDQHRKQQADVTGLNSEPQNTAPPFSDELEVFDEDVIPLLDEVCVIKTEEEVHGDSLPLELADEGKKHIPSTAEATTVEEYFAAVAAARHLPQIETSVPPMLDEEVATTDEVIIPILDEVFSPDDAIPLLDDVVTTENAIPLLDDLVTTEDAIPLLDEIVTSEELIPVLNEAVAEHPAGAPDELSLDDIQGLIDLIVNRKLQRLKPELEREVMEELQKLLPAATFRSPRA
jgi:hypothetical protein